LINNNVPVSGHPTFRQVARLSVFEFALNFSHIVSCSINLIR